jgi:hypothetical protein
MEGIVIDTNVFVAAGFNRRMRHIGGLIPSFSA